jgi:hypothetical protein
MMNRRHFLLGVAGALGSGDRVYLIGDSQAFLLRYELAPLARADGVALGHSTIGGSSIISWSMRHQQQLQACRNFHPTLTLVALGSNDAYMGARVITNEPPYLKRLLRQMRGRVLWVGPPDLPKAREGVDAVAGMVRAEGVEYLDSRSIQLAMWDDQLHCARPHPEGCSKWARWIWDQVRALPPVPQLQPATGR